jgi:hypothetical protein
MIRVFAVVFAFVMILTMGYVCVSPELDESDELILSGPEVDETHEVIQIGHNVTSLRLYLIASDQFSPIHHPTRFSIRRFAGSVPTEITCSWRC